MTDLHKDYLFDLGYEIRLGADEASRALAESVRGTEENSIAYGRALAYSEVISLMQQNAAGMGLSLEDLRLNGVDSEGFLSNLGKHE
jgi:hypothetical protein